MLVYVDAYMCGGSFSLGLLSVGITSTSQYAQFLCFVLVVFKDRFWGSNLGSRAWKANTLLNYLSDPCIKKYIQKLEGDGEYSSVVVFALYALGPGFIP